ncbi:MAG TPA: ECF-type sigma factor [Urbifossiella sp.]|jgi:hypothetical protein|nr:ECF-type sigma factor [Urbifossiella sp.]
MAAHLAHEVVKPLVAGSEWLTFALDDTPTERSGPHVQGAGVHHNPTPGPAGGPFVYGHVWVVRGLLARHPVWGVAPLPLLARPYVRQNNLLGIAAKHRPPVAATDPDPAEAVALAEGAERMLAALGNDELRQAAVVALEGYTNAEIAAAIGKVEPTVERKRVREEWSAMGTG